MECVLQRINMYLYRPNLVNLPLATTLELIPMREQMITYMLQEKQQLEQHLEDLRRQRLIEIPFNNFVLLRYWKRVKLVDTLTTQTIISQCPYLSSQLTDRQIYVHDIPLDEYLDYIEDCMRYPYIYMYMYSEASNRIKWIACREYLPLRDQHFRQACAPTEAERERRKKNILGLILKQIEKRSGSMRLSEHLEIKANTYCLLDPPKTVMVDPLDYPLDRRHLLTHPCLTEQETKHLPHFDTPDGYDPQHDLVDVICHQPIIESRKHMMKLIRRGSFILSQEATEQDLVLVGEDHSDPFSGAD